MTHPVDIYVGKRLRQRRTLLGMSQDNLAKEVNITFQQIQKYERGTNRIGASRLYEFSKILGVKADYFFEGFEEELPTQHTGMREEPAVFTHETDQFSTRETLEMVRAYYRIASEKTRRAIADMIKAIADNAPLIKD
jgi:transcriptional regulator with XRE-family HTH domain